MPLLKKKKDLKFKNLTVDPKKLGKEGQTKPRVSRIKKMIKIRAKVTKK